MLVCMKALVLLTVTTFSRVFGVDQCVTKRRPRVGRRKQLKLTHRRRLRDVALLTLNHKVGVSEFDL